MLTKNVNPGWIANALYNMESVQNSEALQAKLSEFIPNTQAKKLGQSAIDNDSVEKVFSEAKNQFRGNEKVLKQIAEVEKNPKADAVGKIIIQTAQEKINDLKPIKIDKAQYNDAINYDPNAQSSITVHSATGDFVQDMRNVGLNVTEQVLNVAQKLDMYGAQSYIQGISQNIRTKGELVDYTNKFMQAYEDGRINNNNDVEGSKWVGQLNSTYFNANNAGFAWRAGRMDAQAHLESLNEAAPYKTIERGDFAGYTKLNDSNTYISGDIDVKSLNETQKLNLSFVNQVARLIGKNTNFIVTLGTDINGKYNADTNSITVDLNSGNNNQGLVAQTLAHELTHMIKEFAPANFDAIANYLNGIYGRKGVSLRGLVSQTISDHAAQGYDISYEVAYEEVVAKSMESMLQDGKVLDRLVELENIQPGFLQRVKNFIHNILNKLKSLINNYGPDSAEGRYIANMQNELSALEEMYAQALNQARINAQNAQVVENDGRANVEKLSSKKKRVYNKKSNYDEFNTNAMQWAYNSSTEVGDVTIRYDGNAPLLIMATKVDEGYIILNSGSYDYLQGVKEEYEQYKTDSVESSFDENSKELRIREGNDNWDNVIFENRGTNKENGTLPITSGKNSNGAGNTEGIVSDSQIDSEYIELAKDPAKNKARLRELVDQAAKENGYSRPMFHGSRKSADIKVFKDWQYFTENKAYAERYADAKLYEVFVKLGQVFDTREESARELFYEARNDYGMSNLNDNGLPDWTDGYDICDYIDENNLSYDSVVLDEGGDMVDGKPVSRGESYVVRKSAQVKSADLVTYDDKGEIIPLSKRFNEKNEDTRYSLKKNSNGDLLTQAQAEYFKDSKIRDEEGNLVIVYHGTDAEFTVFDSSKARANMDIQGNFFSPWEIDAGGYGPNVRAFYLNITNPASESEAYKALKMFQGQNNAGVKARDYLINKGYDGVNNSNEEYIAFYPKQIKLIDNLNPTENNDFRYSLKNVDEMSQKEKNQFKNEFYQKRAKLHKDENGKYRSPTIDEEINFYKKYQRGTANKDNFYMSTIAKFEPLSKRPNRAPDYISYSKYSGISSEYWYTDDGVIRGSNHWGAGVASCDWYLGDNKTFVASDISDNNNVRYGYCAWEDFAYKTANGLSSFDKPVAEGKLGDTKYSIRNIVDSDGYDYGTGVYLDSDLFTGLTEDERIEMLKELVVGELAGTKLTFFDGNYNEVSVRIAKDDEKIKRSKTNSNRKTKVLQELYKKRAKSKPKQEILALIGETTRVSRYLGVDSVKEGKNHEWLDNYGKNDWDLWGTPVQNKEGDIFAVLLHVANTTSGEKILYDISPINKERWRAGYESLLLTTNDSVQDSPENVKQFLSLRNSGLSTRNILAAALNETALNETESGIVSKYLETATALDQKRADVDKLKAERKALMFRPGKRDTVRISELTKEINRGEAYISRYDRTLLQLQAMKPMQDLLAREKQKAFKKAQAEGRQALAEYREKSTLAMMEQKQHYIEKAHSDKIARDRTAMKNKVWRVYKSVSDLLLKGTNERNVKTPLRGATAKALQSFDMTMVDYEARLKSIEERMANAKDPTQLNHLQQMYDKALVNQQNMTNSLNALRTAYQDITSAESDSDLSGSFDDTVNGLIEEAVKETKGKNLAQMSLDEMTSVYKAFQAVTHQIRTANKNFAENLKATRKATAENALHDIETSGKEFGARTRIGMEVNKYFTSLMKPAYFFEYIKSPTMQILFDNLVKAEGDTAVFLQNARDFCKNLQDKYEVSKWKFDKFYTFEEGSQYADVQMGKSTRTFDLNLNQMMEIYILSLREEAKNHLLVGGFTYSKNFKKDGKLANISQVFKLSEQTLDAIAKTLTPEQRSFAKEMQKFLATDCAEAGNKVSQAMYGVDNFTDKNYFPMKSSSDYTMQLTEADVKKSGAQKPRLKNMGFTKKLTPRASNPLVIDGFMNSWGKHVAQMANYSNWTLPLEDIERIYKYKLPNAYSNTTTFAIELEKAYGSNVRNYLGTLIDDLNGGFRGGSDTSLLDTLFSKFKKNAVFMSASVVVQQPSAILRAAAYIDPKYFVKSSFHEPRSHAKSWAELKKYAPVAIVKEMGGYDMVGGQSTVEWLTNDKGDTIKMTNSF